MGQYKVPSNVETEDKILGPLSVKQFIYVVIGIMWGFIAIRLIAPFNLVVGLVIAAPISLTMFALGFIQREGVSFENYFLAAISYLLSPRKLVWHKDEHIKVIKETPKPAAAPERLRDVSPGQLQKLAFTLDTHGNTKDQSIQLADSTDATQQQASRVLDPSTVNQTQAQAVATGNYSSTLPTPQPTQKDDVLDSTSNRSSEVKQLLNNVEVNLREQAVANMQQQIAAVPVETPTASITQKTPIADPITEVARHNNAPVERLAREANAAVLQQGQEVQLRPKAEPTG